jgi:uncharacterized protein (DUF362 family)
MNRRELLKQLAEAGGAVLAAPLLGACQTRSANAGNGLNRTATTKVAFVKTSDRAAGVKRAIELLKLDSLKGKDLFIKPNFNSADATPGSTHNDTLAALIEKLRALGAKDLTLGDRSGMGNTREVMEAKEAFRLAKEMKLKSVVLDELSAADWKLFAPSGSHWQKGFALPRPLIEAGGVVQTCCLKTHRYGGHFTLSLKNSVGLAAKRVPGDAYNFMSELHGSPDQRRMIAEINAAYRPDLIVLDGVEAFTTGGPDTGKKVDSQIILAGTDRVAIDALGVAILRHFGTTPEVERGKIFEQEQLARAVELGIGVSSPEQIELLTDDASSAEYAAKIRDVLNGKSQPKNTSL